MTTTDIAVRENGHHLAERDVVDGWIAVASDVIKVANIIADTDFVPAEYRTNAPAVAAAMLTGRELGIGPMMSLRHVQIVRGVPTLSAEYKRARVLAAGHEFDILEIGTQRCRVSGRRKGSTKPPLVVTFTIEDAKNAKIYKPGGAWETRPRRMLFARAGSELCDFIFADVTNGLPTAELVADGDGGDEFAAYSEAPAQAAPAASNGNGEAPRPGTARRRKPPAQPPAAQPQPAATAAPAEGQPPLPGEEEQAAESPPAGEPPARVGLIVRHFERLGYGDRDVRLGMTSRLVGREVHSTRDLDENEQTAVCDLLAQCKTRRQLDTLLNEAGDGTGGGDG